MAKDKWIILYMLIVLGLEKKHLPTPKMGDRPTAKTFFKDDLIMRGHYTNRIIIGPDKEILFV